MVSLHYTGIGLFGMVSLGKIFGYTYSWLHNFLVAKLLLVAKNFNGQCSNPPLDTGLSYSQLQFWSKKLPWTPPPSWLGVCVYLLKRSKTCTRFTTSIWPSTTHFCTQGATGEVYSQWPTKTLYASCVNVAAFVETVDFRFCWWGLFS